MKSIKIYITCNAMRLVPEPGHNIIYYLIRNMTSFTLAAERRSIVVMIEKLKGRRTRS